MWWSYTNAVGFQCPSWRKLLAWTQKRQTWHSEWKLCMWAFFLVRSASVSRRGNSPKRLRCGWGFPSQICFPPYFVANILVKSCTFCVDQTWMFLLWRSDVKLITIVCSCHVLPVLWNAPHTLLWILRLIQSITFLGCNHTFSVGTGVND